MKILVEKKVVYDRETLFDQVWEEPIVRVAEKYGVSDVMIHKYCRKLDIPTPPAGYWRKKEMGHKVPTEKAGENRKGDEELQAHSRGDRKHHCHEQRFV